jgi:hypothetical protein
MAPLPLLIRLAQLSQSKAFQLYLSGQLQMALRPINSFTGVYAVPKMLAAV